MMQNFIRLLESKTSHAVTKSGSGYSACCPAHDDAHPSLSISEGIDGKILVNCFAGCSPEDICHSIGIKVTDLFPEKMRP